MPTSSVAGALATVIMFLATFAFFLPSGDDDDGPGPFGMLALLLLGPLAASMIQLAISRSRELRARCRCPLTGPCWRPAT